MNFCIVNTRRCQIPIWGAKYFACFSKFLLRKGYFKKWIAMRNKIPSLPSIPVLTPLSYWGVIRVKMF